MEKTEDKRRDEGGGQLAEPAQAVEHYLSAGYFLKYRCADDGVEQIRQDIVAYELADAVSRAPEIEEEGGEVSGVDAQTPEPERARDVEQEASGGESLLFGRIGRQLSQHRLSDDDAQPETERASDHYPQDDPDRSRRHGGTELLYEFGYISGEISRIELLEGRVETAVEKLTGDHRD